MKNWAIKGQARDGTKRHKEHEDHHQGKVFESEGKQQGIAKYQGPSLSPAVPYGYQQEGKTLEDGEYDCRVGHRSGRRTRPNWGKPVGGVIDGMAMGSM